MRVFSNEELILHWNYNLKFRPFIINFLYVTSFQLGKRINRQRLIELDIINGSTNELRGLKPISKEKFITILKETKTNESLIVD